MQRGCLNLSAKSTFPLKPLCTQYLHKIAAALPLIDVENIVVDPTDVLRLSILVGAVLAEAFDEKL